MKYNIKPLISIIIPVYNTEKYIEECITSLLNQSLKEIEIICINDGSTDNSLKLLKDFEQKDPRIIVISQENSGPANARNIGLNSASADYIYFMDSDDYISNNFLESMYNKAKASKADIVINDNIICFYEEDKNKTAAFIKNKFPDGTYKVTPEYIKKRDLNNVLWSKIYKKSLIIDNKIKFPNIKTYEDCYFYSVILPLAKTVVQNNDETYYYRNHNTSITSRKNKNNNNDNLKAFEAIYLFYKQNNLLGKFYLPYRILGYRSKIVQNYKSYRTDFLDMINRLNLDIKEIKEDTKLRLLLESQNRFIYGIKKFFNKLT